MMRAGARNAATRCARASTDGSWSVRRPISPVHPDSIRYLQRPAITPRSFGPLLWHTAANT
eukprot:6728705-Heterocapsa_arctica.AAC.1